MNQHEKDVSMVRGWLECRGDDVKSAFERVAGNDGGYLMGFFHGCLTIIIGAVISMFIW